MAYDLDHFCVQEIKNSANLSSAEEVSAKYFCSHNIDLLLKIKDFQKSPSNKWRLNEIN